MNGVLHTFPICWGLHTTGLGLCWQGSASQLRGRSKAYGFGVDVHRPVAPRWAGFALGGVAVCRFGWGWGGSVGNRSFLAVSAWRLVSAWKLVLPPNTEFRRGAVKITPSSRCCRRLGFGVECSRT